MLASHSRPWVHTHTHTLTKTNRKWFKMVTGFLLFSLTDFDCCFENPTPDDSWFKYAAEYYAKGNELMRNGRACSAEFEFENGITNGAKWYFVDGIRKIIFIRTFICVLQLLHAVILTILLPGLTLESCFFFLFFMCVF